MEFFKDGKRYKLTLTDENGKTVHIYELETAYRSTTFLKDDIENALVDGLSQKTGVINQRK